MGFIFVRFRETRKPEKGYPVVAKNEKPVQNPRVFPQRTVPPAAPSQPGAPSQPAAPSQPGAPTQPNVVNDSLVESVTDDTTKTCGIICNGSASIGSVLQCLYHSKYVRDVILKCTNNDPCSKALKTFLTRLAVEDGKAANSGTLVKALKKDSVIEKCLEGNNGYEFFSLLLNKFDNPHTLLTEKCESVEEASKAITENPKAWVFGETESPPPLSFKSGDDMFSVVLFCRKHAIGNDTCYVRRDENTWMKYSGRQVSVVKNPDMDRRYLTVYHRAATAKRKRERDSDAPSAKKQKTESNDVAKMDEDDEDELF